MPFAAPYPSPFGFLLYTFRSGIAPTPKMSIVSGIQKGIPKLQEKRLRWLIEEGETGKSFPPLSHLSPQTLDKAGPAQKVSGCIDMRILPSFEPFFPSPGPPHAFSSRPPLAPLLGLPDQYYLLKWRQPGPRIQRATPSRVWLLWSHRGSSSLPLPWDAKVWSSWNDQLRQEGRFCVCLSVLLASGCVSSL